MRFPTHIVAELQPEFDATLWRAGALAREGKSLLVGRRRKLLLQRTYSVVVYLLGVLDSQFFLTHYEGKSDEMPIHEDAREADRIKHSLDIANAELDKITTYLADSAQRIAQRRYIVGMPCGAVGLSMLALAATKLRVDGLQVSLMVVALLAGGLGAMVSVMTRVTRGDLRLDAYADRMVVVVSGAFRPLIGGVLAVALHFAVRADVLPIKPDDGATPVYFFGVLGFLAGFSERWAREMLMSSAPMSERSNSHVPPEPKSAMSHNGQPAG